MGYTREMAIRIGQSFEWLGMTANISAFNLRVHLACLPSGYMGSEIRVLLQLAGELSAIEESTIESPLIDIVDQKIFRAWFDQFSAKQHFQFGYFFGHQDVRPLDYFVVSGGKAFVDITSKEVDGGAGHLSLHRRQVRNVFSVAKQLFLTSWESWANDPCPVGGTTVLMRDPSHTNMLELDPDTHPSTGSLFFGNADQELKQLAAFCKLQPIVEKFLSDSEPSEAIRNAARARAKKIIGREGNQFVPINGFCSCCECDVTEIIGDENTWITGCPVCGYSWCE